MIRKNCRQDVCALLEMNELFMKKEAIAFTIGKRVSTVAKTLGILRKDGKVVLYKNRWWGFKFPDREGKL